MTVSLIVPLTTQGSERLANWVWVRRRYEALHPAWEIVTHDDPGEGEWSKGRAVHAAVQASRGDVLVIADADLIVGPGPLERAVQSLDVDPWVVPHSGVYRLTRHVTNNVLREEPAGITVRPLPRSSLARRLYQGPAGGGLVVLTREAYDETGGIDPRFLGWGGEDISFARALDTLVGPHRRLGAPLWHLFHKPLYGTRRVGSPASAALAGRYVDAKNDPDAMRTLIAEARPGCSVKSDSTMPAGQRS